MVLQSPMKMMIQSYQSLFQSGHSSTFILLILMILLLSLIILQLLISTILMNLILTIYVKTSNPVNDNLVVYVEPTKSPVPLDLHKF